MPPVDSHHANLYSASDVSETVPPVDSNNVPIAPEYDDDLRINSVNFQQRRTAVESKSSLTIPRDSDVVRPRRQLDIPALIQSHTDPELSVAVVALLDSGCTATVMDTEFARQKGFELKPLARAILVKNADGSFNRAGAVMHYVELVMTVQGHQETLPMPLASLGSCPLFIGYDWLDFHNPEIDWKRHTLEFSRCPSSCGTPHDDEEADVLDEEGLEDGDRIFALDLVAYSSLWEEELAFRHAMHIRAFQTTASRIAEEQARLQKEQTFAERVPSAYHDFREVFSKEHFDQLPAHTPYDHALKLTCDFKPVLGKLYPLSPEEQKELDKFLQENLASGRISVAVTCQRLRKTQPKRRRAQVQTIKE